MPRSIIALLHVGYWFLYGLLWALIILLVAATTRSGSNTPLQTWRFIYFVGAFWIIPAILGFYTFYAWLFPQFLQKGKILALFLVGLAAAIGCGVLSAAILSVLFPDFSFFNDGLNSGGTITLILNIIALLNGGVGLVIKGFMTLQTFRELEREIPGHLICRVHKSYMVAIDKIESIEKEVIKIGEKYVPVSETYRKVFWRLIQGKE